MSRKSVREELKRQLLDHLAIAETHTPEEYALDVRSVSTALHVSPTTLYKYGFNREINAAEQRQRQNAGSTGAAIEQDYFKNQLRTLTEELERERERSKNLVGRIAIDGDAESYATSVENLNKCGEEAIYEKLYQAIAELTPASAEIFTLRYVHNYSDAQIAKLLGTSRGTIAVSLYRSRARLKKLIRSYIWESS